MNHLVAIFEYIATNSPVYATGSEQIAGHPFCGRKVPD
jgi:hypothetical protein